MTQCAKYVKAKGRRWVSPDLSFLAGINRVSRSLTRKLLVRRSASTARRPIHRAVPLTPRAFHRVVLKTNTAVRSSIIESQETYCGHTLSPQGFNSFSETRRCDRETPMRNKVVEIKTVDQKITLISFLLA